MKVLLFYVLSLAFTFPMCQSLHGLDVDYSWPFDKSVLLSFSCFLLQVVFSDPPEFPF
jgi:hypothetical protein